MEQVRMLIETKRQLGDTNAAGDVLIFSLRVYQ